MNNNPMNMFAQLMQGCQNPQQFIQQIQHMANNNPQAQQALQQFNIANNQMRQSGMSMKQYALQYAKQNGYDINQIVNSLSQFGIKL
jgi:hypothetical protein